MHGTAFLFFEIKKIISILSRNLNLIIEYQMNFKKIFFHFFFLLIFNIDTYYYYRKNSLITPWGKCEIFSTYPNFFQFLCIYNMLFNGAKVKNFTFAPWGDQRVFTVLKKKIFNKLKLGKNIHNRTTIMLVMVCFLFLIVELPITLLSLLAMSLDENIYIDIYIPLVEFMDLSVLIYSSINLVLYCSMSSVFRKELVRIFSGVLYRLILVYNLVVRLFQNYDFY